MLILSFSLGDERYAIDTRQVIELVPRLDLRPVPHAPDFIGGTFSYHGRLVLVIDLQMLTHRRPCRPVLGTRIALVKFHGKSGAEHVLGLMAERVTDVCHVQETDLQDGKILVPDAPYLGQACIQGEKILQLIDVDRVLAAPLQHLLDATA
jgi:chemotaxis-related protein WspB